MDIAFRKKGGNLIVSVYGEVDHHTSETIRDKIEKEFTASGCKNIIFDFENVNFMDSSGIGMVIGRYKFIELSGGKVAVVKANENIDRIFSISGLYKIIPAYKTVEEAAGNM